MSDQILIRIENGVGRITLNRPHALHSLTRLMFQSISTALADWATDPRVHVVMIDHLRGSRGFCSGGDLRVFVGDDARQLDEHRSFFHLEYSLNVAIAEFPKPYLALIDGVTMGGGVGITIHGSHRVATERSIFAMPENAIGLFPDVGAGYFLPRFAGRVGTWLGLTGARLKGPDVAAVGVATHLIASSDIARLRARIAATDFSSHAAESVDRVLGEFSQPLPTGSYLENADRIEHCFGFETVEQIMSALRQDDSLWAAEQLKLLSPLCPTSVKIALRLIREGAKCETMAENMRIEYRIVWRRVASADLAEGVRAVIVDKDDRPRWSPACFEAVTEEMVDHYFQPLGDNELKV